MTMFSRMLIIIQKKKVQAGYDNFTQADTLSEQTIRKLILGYFPDHQITGEEKGTSGSNDYTWYIDPIDGTNNFIGGNNDWGVSVGLAYNHRPLLGALYFPLSKSIYSAEKGKGATKDGKRLKCKNVKKIEDSIICVSSYLQGKQIDNSLRIIKQLGDKPLGIRMYGCAIKNVAMIAEGQVHALIKHKLLPWDSCAGAVIVEEAGGEVFSMDGKPWTTDKESIICASSVQLKKQILKLRF